MRAYYCALLIVLCMHGMAQTPDTGRPAKQTTYILPDGTILPPGKWDSLERTWGKDRLMMRHDNKDDAQGMVHLERLTDEMKQKLADLNSKNEKELAALLNRPAPAFELKDLAGKPYALKKLRGKVVVLNFWFTSCVPCIREMPELNKMVDAYRSKDVVFLGLTFNNAEQVKTFLGKHPFYYMLLPGSHEVDKKYHINSWPTSIVISKKGDIKKIVHSDPKVRETLQAVIDSSL